MNKKLILGNLMLACIILLSACREEKSQETSIIAEAVTPTEPATPTITDTPLPTLTLTPTQIPAELVGMVETQDFILPAGRQVQISDDLILTASGDVDIAGDLMAESSINITIQAVGNITIAGELMFGVAVEGENGGNLTLISESGDIVLLDTAKLASGNGGAGVTELEANGEMTIIKGGQGGHGGSLTLQALNGEVSIPAVPGILHVGKGGEGATIAIHGEDLLITQVEEQLTNVGGNSGDLILMAETMNGAEFVAVTLTEELNILLSGTNLPLGSELYFPTDETLLSGGWAGNAGSLNYGMDDEGNSTWPEPEIIASSLDDVAMEPFWDQANVLAASANWVFSLLIQTENEVDSEKKVIGASGGNGLYGGDGADVYPFGKSGSQPGEDGQSATAIAGKGGSGIFGGGTGGSAYARGGNGANGANPSGNGGAGGNAYATGGDSGVTYATDGDSGVDYLGVFRILSKGGYAKAFGGSGGNGGGACPENVTNQGGLGGPGGLAIANPGLGKVTKPGSFALGGFGGNGGDGLYTPGNGGPFGLATMISDQEDDTESNGENGDDGGTCPPAPKTCTCQTATFSTVAYDGNKLWSDCGTKDACVSIIGNQMVTSGTVISGGGGSCKMQTNCK
jgi:hypothetical protein